jgi:SprT protein
MTTLTDDQRTAVFARVKHFLDMARTRYNREFINPVVLFDLQGRIAGQAWGNYKIRLNIDLLVHNWEEFMQDTIPHEVAHLVQKVLYPYDKSHGRGWKSIMRGFGCNPKRTHNMDLSCTKVRRQARVEASCAHCGKEIKLTTTRAKRLMNGRRYFHPACGPKGVIVLRGSKEVSIERLVAM